IVSAKGGVGKSTLTVNLGRAYASMGQRVLLVDLDVSCRTLDMMMGVEDAALYDVSDVVCGRVSVERAVVPLPQSDNMFLLAGCVDPAFALSAASADALMSRAAQALGADCILLDTHAPDRTAPPLAATVTDTLVVTTPDALSVRAAEQCGVSLSRMGAPRPRLTVNRLDPDAVSSLTLSEMIDLSGLRLIGVVPLDPDMAQAQAQGKMAKEAARPNTVAALRNIACRLAGRRVPLLTDWRGVNRRQILR
ncbi:MAG: P-loop NTPase, partial [Clostridia bacterium]|nr:P-loop NTPase [Clostridia bacterium]